MSVDTLPRTLGRYRLYEQIATGGMAAVHFGRLLGAGSFSRVVAIKRLLEAYARDPDFVRMFLDEARLAARIRHPNVVTTLDVVDDGDEVFLVMEYVLGEPLHRFVRNDGGLVPLPVVSAIMCGVLEGLHAAHEARGDDGEPLHIVHRDVSPQNVLVGADGVARVFDFGIAKAADNAQVTREGMIKGKVSYMPPEQLQVGVIDRRADVFAAGVVFWELLTGRKLRAGEVNDQLFLKLARGDLDPPPPPSSHRHEVPAACDAIVARATAFDRELRHPSARALALVIEEAIPPASPRAVAAWLEGVSHDRLERARRTVQRIEGDADGSEPRLSTRGSSARIALSGTISSPATSTPTQATPPFPLSSSRAPVKRAWVPFVALALVAIGAIFVLRGRDHETPIGPSFGADARDPNAAASPAPSPSPSIAPIEPIVVPASSISVAPSTEPPAKVEPKPRPRPIPAAAPKKEKEPAAPSTKPSIAPTAQHTGCENPFSIGPDGIRQVKPECL